MQLLIKNATILAQSQKWDKKKKDILIENGIIQKISDKITEKDALTLDYKNSYVSPGWFDLFADFSDPGYEHKEDIQSGMACAAAGGFTEVCLLPNTNPVTSTKSQVEYLQKYSSLITIHPIGAISKQLEGKDLAEMYDMKQSGALCFSDGYKPIQSAALMLKALQYVKTFGGTLIQIPREASLSQHGLMNEGVNSTLLGMQGIPSIAESILLERDINLLEYTQSKLHITGISSEKSVKLIRNAKKQGAQLTCSVSPFHLMYTDEALLSYNSLYKVNPPFRTEKDRKALIKGVLDGTIDCIASHHQAQDTDAKQTEFAYAQYGMISLQTLWPMLLSSLSELDIESLAALLYYNSRNVAGIEVPKIEVGEKANLTLFDTHSEWPYHTETNLSKSANSPLLGHTLIGKSLAVINNLQYRIHE